MKKKMEEYPAYLSDTKALTGIDFKSLDDFLEYAEKNLDNLHFQSRALMECSQEIWQIFGVSFLNLNGKNVLYSSANSGFIFDICGFGAKTLFIGSRKKYKIIRAKTANEIKDTIPDAKRLTGRKTA
mgnify:CR=1 FL=1